jgi:hypothetical protein
LISTGTWTSGDSVLRMFSMHDLKTAEDASGIKVGDILMYDTMSFTVMDVFNKGQSLIFKGRLSNLIFPFTDHLNEGHIVVWGKDGMAESFSEYGKNNLFSWWRRKIVYQHYDCC